MTLKPVTEETVEVKRSADTERLQMATEIVSKQFDLDSDYGVKKFDDKGRVVKITMENADFEVSVTIKNSEAYGMYAE